MIVHKITPPFPLPGSLCLYQRLALPLPLPLPPPLPAFASLAPAFGPFASASSAHGSASTTGDFASASSSGPTSTFAPSQAYPPFCHPGPLLCPLHSATLPLSISAQVFPPFPTSLFPIFSFSSKPAPFFAPASGHT